MQKIFSKIIIIFFFLISGCATSWDTVKKGVGGQKRTSTDEFLVKKKDPLNMPPKWKDLPVPGHITESDDEIIDEATDIEELMQLGKNEESLTNLEQGSKNLEESVLKKIKQK